MTLKIGEVAARTGLSTRTLRHYDDLGLLKPVQRSDSAYRLYDESNLQRLLVIGHLKSLGMSLQDIGHALDAPGFQASRMLAQQIECIEERQAGYSELLSRLKRLQATAAINWEEVAEVIALQERLHHPDHNARTLAALSVKPTEKGESVPDLLYRLMHEPDASVREHLTWAIVQMGDVAFAHLQAELRTADPETRLQLIHVLGKLGHSETTAILIPFLADADPRVVRKVLFVLGQLRSPEALDALIGQLGLWSGDLQTATVLEDALQAYGQCALPDLQRALRDERGEVRAQAADILGMLGERDALEALLAALRDPLPDVQFKVLFALRAFQDPAVTQAVTELADHPVPRLRILARRLLQDRQP